MSRGHAILGVLLLGATLGLGHTNLTGTHDEADALAVTPVTTQSTEAAPADSDPFAKIQACTPDEEITLAASCGRCPPEWPRCSRDRDCDSVCGGKGTGVCEQINSCFKCCTCAGTS